LDLKTGKVFEKVVTKLNLWRLFQFFSDGGNQRQYDPHRLWRLR